MLFASVPELTVSCSGGFKRNLGNTKTTNWAMTCARPISLLASHMYTPESSLVVLAMLRFSRLGNERVFGRLENIRVHLTTGEGNPVAMHLGKVALFPSIT